MSTDSIRGGQPRPTNSSTTSGTKETAPTTPTPATTEAADPDADAIGIGEAAATLAADIMTMGAYSRTTALFKGAAELVSGSGAQAVNGVKNISAAYDAIAQLKPGDEVEIGRKLTLEAEGVEGEGEVKVAVERDAEGYVVTFEQSASVGDFAKADDKGLVKADLSVGMGMTGSASIRVKTAAEAQDLVAKGVAAMAAGTSIPGLDTAVLAGTVATSEADETDSADRRGISALSVSLDGTASGGVGIDSKEFSSEIGIKGEVTVSDGLSYERGPPTAVYVELSVDFEASLDGGISGDKLGLQSGQDLAEGTAKVRIPVLVGSDFDPLLLKTAAGRQEILDKAKAADSFEVSVEGTVHAGPYLIEVERKGTGRTLGEALASFRAGKTETEIFRERGPDKASLGFKLDGAAGEIEIATNRKEALSAAEATQISQTMAPSPPKATPKTKAKTATTLPELPGPPPSGLRRGTT